MDGTGSADDLSDRQVLLLAQSGDEGLKRAFKYYCEKVLPQRFRRKVSFGNDKQAYPQALSNFEDAVKILSEDLYTWEAVELGACMDISITTINGSYTLENPNPAGYVEVTSARLTEAGTLEVLGRNLTGGGYPRASIYAKYSDGTEEPLPPVRGLKTLSKKHEKDGLSSLYFKVPSRYEDVVLEVNRTGHMGCEFRLNFNAVADVREHSEGEAEEGETEEGDTDGETDEGTERETQEDDDEGEKTDGADEDQYSGQSAPGETDKPLKLLEESA